MKLLRGGGGSENFLDTRKGGSEKIVGLGRRGGDYFKNLYTSKPT